MKKLSALLAGAALAGCGGGTSNDPPQTVLLASLGTQLTQITAPTALSGERRSYDIGWSNNMLSGTSKVPELNDFRLPSPEIRLQDISLTYDQYGTTGKLYRLYQAAFGRVPDAKGFGYWRDAVINKGIPLDHVAMAFIDSAESKATYGTASDDPTFVGRLYQNVLRRNADAGGSAYWTGALRSGMKRSDVLLMFADSDENKAATAAAATRGMAFAEPGVEYIPVSNATAPTDVPVGILFQVDASTSTDANDDPLSFAWSVTAKPPGSSATFKGPNIATPSIALDLPGIYELTMWASDPHSRSYSPAQLTVVAHALIADTGKYTCSSVSPSNAATLYSLGHTYLDRDKDGKPCTASDIAYEKAPTVPSIPDTGTYKCSAISHDFAVLLYLQGHTYLDRDHDGKPCEATDITIENSTIYVPPLNNGMCWVNGYYRKNGTYVHGYWRHC